MPKDLQEISAELFVTTCWLPILLTFGPYYKLKKIRQKVASRQRQQEAVAPVVVAEGEEI